MRKNVFLILLVPLTFLIVALATLNDYGINWDEPKHLIRGQSYLHYILTGKEDFLDIPPYREMKGAPDFVDYNVTPPTRSKQESSNESITRRSYYQSDFYTFDYFMKKHEHTHPEVNGLLAAISNHIFYQKLGVIGDLEAYHLFIVLVTFALSVCMAIFTYHQFGIFPALVAVGALALTPLVFSEAHFNVKDPVLMGFFGMAIIAIWYGITKNKVKYILLSALLAGFALGTKFNTFFLPLIIGPWILFKGIPRDRKIILSLLAYPFIMLAVLYTFSPYLWTDPINHFLQIVNYYKEIGVGTPGEYSPYLIGGWNTYPIVWTLFTTPLPILLLSLIGFCYSLFLVVRKKSDAALLILLWFSVPILRASWPGTNIYGGIRQIMEFIPAMAILAGMGAYVLVKKSRFKWAQKILPFLITIPLLFAAYELVTIHPNENVYFNQFAGGLSGAKEKNLPSWGNAYGNTYLQGINWLNKNVEQNATLALPVNYISAIPRLKLRSDINLDNANWSGPDRRGEYGMEIDFNSLNSRYKYAYYNTFLNPVYEVKVNGVSLLKIWKNDVEHTKPGYEKETTIKAKSITVKDQGLRIDFNKQILITRLLIDHSNNNCEKQEGSGYMSISQDGVNWARLSEPIFDPESPYVYINQDDDSFVHMFAADKARSIVFNTDLTNPCVLQNYKVTVYAIDN